MKIWSDAQLPPTLANWLTEIFGLEASALRDAGCAFCGFGAVALLLRVGVWLWHN